MTTCGRNRISSLIYLSLIIPFIFGCAGLQTDYDPPVVNLTSFKALPGDGAVPRFEIGLEIINPNRNALRLQGAAYTVSVEGHKILTGVSNQLPVVEGYGRGQVLLEGTVSLFNSIAFFADLARSGTQNNLNYQFDAKLDPGTLHPVIRISKKGTFSLAPVD